MAIKTKVTIEVTIGGEEEGDVGRITVFPHPLGEDLPTRLQIAEFLRRLADTLEVPPPPFGPEWGDWKKNRPYAQLDLSNVVFVDENDRMQLARKTRLPPAPPRR